MMYLLCNILGLLFKDKLYVTISDFAKTQHCESLLPSDSVAGMDE